MASLWQAENEIKAMLQLEAYALEFIETNFLMVLKVI
jgi:hypothetical protein